MAEVDIDAKHLNASTVLLGKMETSYITLLDL